MIVAYHFDAYRYLKNHYGYVFDTFFSTLAACKFTGINSHILSGDLQLHRLIEDIASLKSDNDSISMDVTAENVISTWLKRDWIHLHTLRDAAVDAACNTGVYVFCFSDISRTDARTLDRHLYGNDLYLGYMAPKANSRIHWALYSHYLNPGYHVVGNSLYLLWDGFDESSKDYTESEELRNIGFANVDFEVQLD